MISGLFPRCKRTRCICKRTIPYFGLDGSWIDILRFNYRNQPRIDSVSADRRLMEAARLDRSCLVNLTQGGAAWLRHSALPWATLSHPFRVDCRIGRYTRRWFAT